MRLFCLMLVIIVVLTGGCASSGVYHVVQPGQTLYRICKTYRVPVSRVAAVNHIRNPAAIKVGQKLYIPGVARTRTVSVVPPARRQKSAVTTKRRVSHRQVKKRPPRRKKSPAHKRKPVKVAKGYFRWPLRGKVVKKFNLGNRNMNKGIDIAARVGATVRSAAAGKVIFSGNGITGYGYVVIVEHNPSLYTVYGYNRAVVVKRGQYVKRGQAIAHAGTPPGRRYGRLHFEVWKNKKAVNPLRYLP